MSKRSYPLMYFWGIKYKIADLMVYFFHSKKGSVFNIQIHYSVSE